MALSNNTELVEKFYRKKFAREARWEEWRERFIGIMERFHINYHSYADEHEEEHEEHEADGSAIRSASSRLL